MAHFTIHTAETAGEARELVENTERAFGFLPNLAAVMAESPALLEGYRTLASIFDKTDLSETERQIILMTNNRLNGCEYCMAAHTTISQMKGVPESVITALRENQRLANPKLEALRVFAEQVNLTRGWPTEADVQSFLKAGYSQRTVLEVVLGTGLKVLSNYTNHVAQTPVDSQFQKNEWSESTEPLTA